MLRIETPVSQGAFQGILTGFTMPIAIRAETVVVVKLQAAVLKFFWSMWGNDLAAANCESWLTQDKGTHFFFK